MCFKKLACILLISTILFGCINRRTSENRIIVSENEIFENDNDNANDLHISFEEITAYVSSFNGINLRVEPSITSARIRALPLDTELTLLERSMTQEIIDGLFDYWYKVDTGEETGWVFGGYLSNIKKGNFISHVKITNGALAFNYKVPNINSRTIGINDDEISSNNIENKVRFIWGGFQITLKNDIPLDEDIIVTVKNSKHEFSKILELKPILGAQNYYSDDIIGYYKNIPFENKFWLSDGEFWQIIVSTNNNTLINDRLPHSEINSLLFEKLDETPFITNNLRNVKLFNNYIFRCNKETDLLVLYYNDPNDYSRGYFVYHPVLYIFPDKNITENHFDIGISWNDESLKGMYYFGVYKINDLPTEEKMYALFDSISVR
jgi:hypothetical protein